MNKSYQELHEQYEDMFDDQRILDGKVTDEEIQGLEDELIKDFLNRAKLEGKSITTMYDPEEYEALRKTKELFEGDQYYLLLDTKTEKVLDMAPIIFHSTNLETSLFYAKLILHDECHL